MGGGLVLVRDESCQALRAAGGQEAHLNYRGLSLSCVCWENRCDTL
jgi:hypothetical protein